MEKTGLEKLGWDSWFEERFKPFKEAGFTPARVIVEHRGKYIVRAREGEMAAGVTGKFIHTADSPADYPKTGDWVAVTVFPDENKAIIHALVPRRTLFSRKAAGIKIIEQVLASNIDIAFVVQGLDHNYNRMRLIRYAASLEGNGIRTIVVLNKADINPEAEKIFEETKKFMSPVSVIKVSAKTGEGMVELKSIMKPGLTAVFVGSSGVGKSTIINNLMGEELAETKEVRDDDSRGRHTTVTRQLYRIAGAGMVIDTPGIRELQIWEEEPQAAPDFELITQYAARCRYNDCSHENEPGCAVKEAAAAGKIPDEIIRSYFKLKREMEFIAAKVDEKAAFQRKKKERQFGKMVKEVLKHKKKREV